MAWAMEGHPVTRLCHIFGAAILAASLTSQLSQACAASSTPKQIDIDRIFAPHPIEGRLPSSIVWAPNGRRFLYVTPDPTGKPVDTHVYDAVTHVDRIFFHANANGKGSRPVPEFVWSPDSSRLAYLDGGDVWTIAASGTGKRKIAHDGDDPQWSPDGTKIAYVSSGNLYATPASGGATVRYSFDGNDVVVDGDPDWVYSEELSLRHAYRWAPDSRRIAYLQFDERPIERFQIVDFLAANNALKEQRYPLAGARNSIVTLRVASPGGATRTYYSTKTRGDYLASVGWTPQGNPTAQILDRAQKHLRYVEFARSGTMRTLVSDDSAYWVDVYGAPRWLSDKRHFIFASARDGVESLYLGDRTTGVFRRLTSGYRIGIGQNGDGNGDDGVIGIDEARGVVIVSAAYPARSDETALAIPLRGGPPRPLATGRGSHDFHFAHDAHHYVRVDSTFETPPTFTVGSTVGAGSAVFARAPAMTGYQLGAVERGELPSKYGKLDYWMIKPPNFDRRKKYPVITYVYGGPASPTTADAWDGISYLYHQALAERGFIVFSVDGPGSQVDSQRNEQLLYHALGPNSLAGQLAGADYLASLPYVDKRRLGIWGWSFGGYETTYALTHAPQTWKVGVAVAPVTDWRFYDSIYTERFMGTPRLFPAAYAQSSVVHRAGALRGRLLISHGTSDDNVHLINTLALAQAFIASGRQVDLMLYPRKTHSIGGIAQRRNLFTHMLRYWEEHL